MHSRAQRRALAGLAGNGRPRGHVPSSPARYARTKAVCLCLAERAWCARAGAAVARRAIGWRPV